MSCFFWNCNIFFLNIWALYFWFLPLPFSQRHTSFMFLRHAFAVGMFLVKTDFYLHQLGYGHTVYRSVFAGLPCTCFHVVFITNRWCCCVCFNLKVDLIFLPSYYFSVAVLPPAFLTSQLILWEGNGSQLSIRQSFDESWRQIEALSCILYLMPFGCGLLRACMLILVLLFAVLSGCIYFGLENNVWHTDTL